MINLIFLFYFSPPLTFVARLGARVITEEAFVTGITDTVADFAGDFATAVTFRADAALKDLDVGALMIFLETDIAGLGIAYILGG